MNDRELQGRTAIVTGGSRGIGRSIVQELASAGCNVVFTYANHAEAAEQTLACLNGDGERVRAVKADVRDAADAARIVEFAASSFSPCSILVNNAGIIQDGPLATMKPSAWEEVLDTNLNGCFHYVRALTPQLMRMNGGRIVNITSISAVHGMPGQSNYCAAKAGMIGFTKAVAKELGPFNVTVNAIAPGYIETEMLDHLTALYKNKMRQMTPLQRFGQPCEVAKMVRFLASDAASYITGQVIGIDGGVGI